MAAIIDPGVRAAHRLLFSDPMTFDDAQAVFAAPLRERVEFVVILKRALRSLFDDPTVDESDAEELAGGYPAVEYTPPHGRFSLDLLTRLGEAFGWEDLMAGSEPLTIGSLAVPTATPRTRGAPGARSGALGEGLPLGGVASRQPAYDERADFGDALEVAIDVNDAEPVVQGRAGDEQIWNRRSVPHAVVMSQVALQGQGSLEQVGWRRDDLEGLAQVDLKDIVVRGGACRVELLELAHRAQEQGSRQLGERLPHSLLAAAGGGALVEEPAPHRHICSEASTPTSTRRTSCARNSRCLAARRARSLSALSAARRRASSTVARVVASPSACLARASRSWSISIVVRLIMSTY
jgi:hypothetical protein